MPVRFGDCRLDLEARTLSRNGRDVHLLPKPFELLSILLDARPRPISKSELIERVWPGRFMSDGSLTRAVNQVRAAVGDMTRDGGIIRTVHGYGYAFAADIVDERIATADAPPRQACWIVMGRRSFPLTEGEHIVGREPDAAVWLDSPRVSRRHARLVVSGTRAIVEDLASKNGTFVRGERISAPVTLESGDRIRVGPFALTFRVGIDSRSTESADRGLE